MPDRYEFEHETMRELRRLVLAVNDAPTQVALFAILEVVHDLAAAHYIDAGDGGFSHVPYP